MAHISQLLDYVPPGQGHCVENLDGRLKKKKTVTLCKHATGVVSFQYTQGHHY